MTKFSTEGNRQEYELDSQIKDIGNGISEETLQSIRAVLSKPNDIYKLFFLFTKRLNKLFSISQSSLILYSQNENKLKVIAMKGEKGTRKGLALTLPEKDSLLYKLFENNQFYVQHQPENFDCNFIEQKIMKCETALSLAVMPIVQDSTKYGLVCLSSPVQDAFIAFENGQLDKTFEDFSKNLIARISTANI